jgi:hypothetical protein
VQNLIPEDHEARINFCTWLLQQHDADPNFVNNILFTDESLFSREGTFNYHNYHIWAEENPHAKHVRRFQHRFTINLWAGTLGDSIQFKRTTLHEFPRTKFAGIVGRCTTTTFFE